MKMALSKIRLEIAAHSLYSAMQAEMGGADRIELCSALLTGGLTPSPGIIRLVRDKISIPIHVLIRPRLGGFVYTELEIESMINSITFCKSLGIHGVVVGCVRDSQIDEDQIKRLIRASDGMDLTFHRAFDLLNEPFAELELLIKLGFKRILTSGQAVTAWEGRDVLKKLCDQAGGRLTIMPGAGIHSKNIIDLFHATGCEAFHSSAKQPIHEEDGDHLQITTINGKVIPRFETEWHEVAAMRHKLDLQIL